MKSSERDFNGAVAISRGYKPSGDMYISKCQVLKASELDNAEDDR